MRSARASTIACFSLRTFAFGRSVFHLHTISVAPKKKTSASEKTQRHKNNQSLLMSSAGFTGRTHLLSSERSNNIYQAVALVNTFLRVFSGRRRIFRYTPAAEKNLSEKAIPGQRCRRGRDGASCVLDERMDPCAGRLRRIRTGRRDLSFPKPGIRLILFYRKPHLTGIGRKRLLVPIRTIDRRQRTERRYGRRSRPNAESWPQA